MFKFCTLKFLFCVHMKAFSITKTKPIKGKWNTLLIFSSAPETKSVCLNNYDHQISAYTSGSLRTRLITV